MQEKQQSSIQLEGVEMRKEGGFKAPHLEVGTSYLHILGDIIGVAAKISRHSQVQSPLQFCFDGHVTDPQGTPWSSADC
ncbi:hypothetical protein V6N11_003555 [Hibiscus sabdariffa]|uniref:Uncharacterized protein n=1 Tax=Hibiscus sabdariffa TaxID=183260 RepID=A0ABR2SEC2_9ROSI